MSERRCGFVPFPGYGAYGHWRCELARWHGRVLYPAMYRPVDPTSRRLPTDGSRPPLVEVVDTASGGEAATND
jgi:hypothetical protein